MPKLVAFLKALANMYPRWICKREFQRQKFARFNERAIEYGFVFNRMAELCPKRVLDVGTGTTALPHVMRSCGPMVAASDNVRDYWPNGMFNRHYHVIDDDIRNPNLREKFDLITCISVLEHIQQPDEAVAGMFGLLAEGGHLILTFPYNESTYVHNVYELPNSSYGQDAPYITQSYCRSDLDRWLQQNDGCILMQEHWQCWDGDFWTVGEQIIPPRRVGPLDKHQLACVLLGKRRSARPEQVPARV